MRGATPEVDQKAPFGFAERTSTGKFRGRRGRQESGQGEAQGGQSAQAKNGPAGTVLGQVLGMSEIIQHESDAAASYQSHTKSSRA